MGSFISKGVSLDDWKETTKLSYSWYWILACIPFGLEQLYLGSPKTFFLKNIMNVFLLGYPWLYEVFMATWGRPQVELFGSPNPLSTGIHVGGGRFAMAGEPVSDIHLRAFGYPFILVLLGIVGGDSFLMGNYTTGFFRLFCTLTVFLLPISLVWWIYKIFLYIFVTDSVYAEDGEFFGYPPAKKGSCPSTLEHLTAWLVAVAKAITSPIPGIGPLVATIADSYSATVGFTKSVLGFTIDQVTATVKGVQKITSQVSTLEPGDIEAKKVEEVTAAAAAAEVPQKEQKGGGSPVLDTSSALGALLTGTIGFIFVSSIVLSWRRTYQNAGFKSTKAATSTTATTSTTSTTVQRPGEGDDVPPEPRGARAAAEGA
jgi:hypothetical protein